MSQPSVTYTLNWGTNLAQKLSGRVFTKPDGTYVDCTKVDGTITPSVNGNKIYITAVKEGRDYGFINDVLVDIRDKNPTGHKIIDVDSPSKSASYNFSISTSTHLVDGDGIYRIGLYIQDTEGYWNYEYFFIAFESQQVIMKGNEPLQVIVKTT